MSNIQPFQQGPGMLARDARQSGRAISRHVSVHQTSITRLDLQTDLAIAKVGCTTAVTASMMSDVVRVAQAQRQLELLAPEASGRLALIADNHVLGLVELESDFRRNLRRI